ncbi:UPF0755 protein [Pseudarcicella hirudinis]|uniref:Endolytic murein transglycosylase n=1 Tax=Pseudarcicella hirudinis TaxID=1079859 RepID=A0A1I5SS63_9BACT|nr:endolytic transglycosylase MltG [Pseudarcicella hirudinis]SFP73642.1 UPF0755 protein [Pseudarcicella hirudinis]
MQKSSKLFRYLILAFSLFAAMFSYYIWQVAKTPNFKTDEKTGYYLLIPSGATFETVWDSLSKKKIVKDELSFKFLVKLLKYRENVKEGRYKITAEMGNYEMLKKLKSGNQDPVRLTFNNVRLKKDLIHKIGNRFEFDSTKFASMLESEELAQKYGFTSETIMCMFLPNTYNILWNTKPEKFFGRMKSEYDHFWTDARKKRAQELGFTPIQVAILASIVEEETKAEDEKPKVAGLYINRLNLKMPLQADPTVKFALKDFAIKRILTAQLQVNSPYNTYKIIGLPPGPIRLAELSSIDAVLNYEKHNYTYMCANPALNGTHIFAENFQDHLNNARLYQAALNKLNIRK